MAEWRPRGAPRVRPAGRPGYLGVPLAPPMHHVPNTLTAGRIVAAPVALYLLWTGTPWGQTAGTALFIAAAITDYLDGHLARTYNVTSRLGQFLDPLADKVLVLGGFLLVPFLSPVGEGLAAPAGTWLPWAAIAAVALRDAAVTALRASYERRGVSLATSSAAKWKTTFQLTFLIATFVFLSGTHLRGLGGAPGALGRGLASILLSPAPLALLLATAAVTVWTGVLYFRAGQPS